MEKTTDKNKFNFCSKCIAEGNRFLQVTDRQKQELDTYYRSKLRKKEDIISNLEEDKENLIQKINEFKCQHEEIVEQFKSRLDELHQDCSSHGNESSSNTLPHQYEDKMTELRTQHQLEIEGKDAIIKSLREQLETQQHEQFIKKLRSKDNDEIEELRQKHEEEIERIRLEHAAELEATQRALESKYKRDEDDVQNMVTELHDTLQTLLEEKVTMQENHQREMEMKENEIKFFQENACLQESSNVSQMNAAHQEKVKRLMTEISSIKKQHRTTMKEVKNEHLEEISKLTSRYEDMLKSYTKEKNVIGGPCDGWSHRRQEALQRLCIELDERRRQLYLAIMELEGITINDSNDVQANQVLMIVYNAKQKVVQRLEEDVEILEHEISKLESRNEDNSNVPPEQLGLTSNRNYSTPVKSPMKSPATPSVAALSVKIRPSLSTPSKSATPRRKECHVLPTPHNHRDTRSILSDSPSDSICSPSTTVIREGSNGILGAMPGTLLELDEATSAVIPQRHPSIYKDSNHKENFQPNPRTPGSKRRQSLRWTEPKYMEKEVPAEGSRAFFQNITCCHSPHKSQTLSPTSCTTPNSAASSNFSDASCLSYASSKLSCTSEINSLRSCASHASCVSHDASCMSPNSFASYVSRASRESSCISEASRATCASECTATTVTALADHGTSIATAVISSNDFGNSLFTDASPMHFGDRGKSNSLSSRTIILADRYNG